MRQLIEHDPRRALLEQLELVQTRMPMCRNRPVVQLAAHLDRFAMQAVVGLEMPNLTESDSNGWRMSS